MRGIDTIEGRMVASLPCDNNSTEKPRPGSVVQTAMLLETFTASCDDSGWRPPRLGALGIAYGGPSSVVADMG